MDWEPCIYKLENVNEQKWDVNVCRSFNHTNPSISLPHDWIFDEHTILFWKISCETSWLMCEKYKIVTWVILSYEYKIVQITLRFWILCQLLDVIMMSWFTQATRKLNKSKSNYENQLLIFINWIQS